MKFIETPMGDVYKLDDCKIFVDDLDNSEIFFNTENQEKLAKELFKNTGILVSELKGGENTG